jgi:hypothetical protein
METCSVSCDAVTFSFFLSMLYFYGALNIRGAGLISLWLHKENNKLWDWKRCIYSTCITPWLRCSNFFNPSKKHSFVRAANRKQEKPKTYQHPYVYEHRMVGRLVNDELERIWREAIVTKFRYYPGTCLEGLRKTSKGFNHENQPFGVYLNRAFKPKRYGYLSVLFMKIFFCSAGRGSGERRRGSFWKVNDYSRGA